MTFYANSIPSDTPNLPAMSGIPSDFTPNFGHSSIESWASAARTGTGLDALMPTNGIRPGFASHATTTRQVFPIPDSTNNYPVEKFRRTQAVFTVIDRPDDGQRNRDHMYTLGGVNRMLADATREYQNKIDIIRAAIPGFKDATEEQLLQHTMNNEQLDHAPRLIERPEADDQLFCRNDTVKRLLRLNTEAGILNALAFAGCIKGEATPSSEGGGNGYGVSVGGDSEITNYWGNGPACQLNMKLFFVLKRVQVDVHNNCFRPYQFIPWSQGDSLLSHYVNDQSVLDYESAGRGVPFAKDLCYKDHNGNMRYAEPQYVGLVSEPPADNARQSLIPLMHSHELDVASQTEATIAGGNHTMRIAMMELDLPVIY